MPSGSPATQFTSETAPRQGGKRGRTNTRTKVRLLAEEIIEQRMQELFNTSLENVAASIEGSGSGDERVEPDVGRSAWFLEMFMKHKGRRLKKTIDLQIRTLDDVENISIETVERVLRGDLTFEEAREIQEMVARHVSLSGVVELTNLRAELDEFKTTHNIGTDHSNEHMPAWGRLKEITAKPKAEEAEVVVEEKPKPKRRRKKAAPKDG